MQPCAVSILVPVYNVKKYLRECLDSLERQTLEDIQIICIDDGSTDSSPEILAEFQGRDPRFEIITKKNSGYGDSMNQGLAQARGEYIGIVESDDFVNLDMFEKLYKIATKNDVDIVKSNFFEHSFHDGRNWDIFIDNLFHCVCDEVFCPADNQNIFLTQPAIWSALYKRSFLEDNDIKFLPTPGASFQDTSFNFKVFGAANRVILTHDAFLHYRTDNDTSSVKSQSKVFPICDEYDEIWRFAKARPALWEKIAQTIPHIQYGGYIWNLRRLSPEIQYGFYEKFVETFKDISNNGLLDLSRFDPPVQKDIRDMLNDPNEFFKQEFGPLQVDNTYIISAPTNCANLINIIATQIGTNTDDNTEIICVAPDNDEQTRRTIEELRENDKRFFLKEGLFSNPYIECIDLARIRGKHLFMCGIFKSIATEIKEADDKLRQLTDEQLDEAPSDQNSDIEEAHAEELAAEIEQKETLLAEDLTSQLERLAAQKDDAATDTVTYYCADFDAGTTRYNKEALDSLDLPIIMPLLFTAFYSQKLNAITEGSLSLTPHINADTELCPLKEYKDAVKSLASLMTWNKYLLEEENVSYEEKKTAHRQIADLWHQIRALHAGLAYQDRTAAGEPLSTPDTALLVFRNNDATRAQSNERADISIIIPVYNKEDHLTECLESVLSQKNCSKEIICINDGSTDGSLDILEKFADQNENITVITQFNEGVAIARNRGIDNVTGDWVAFIDPDDYYAADDALVALIDAARKNDVLLCGGSFSAVDEKTGKIQEVFHGEESTYVYTEEGYRTFAKDQYDYGWVRFIYHHSLFEDGKSRFPLLSHYEDPVFITRISSQLDRYYGITKMIYRYRTNYKETTWRAARTVDMLKGIKINMDIAREKNYNQLYTLLVKRLEVDYYHPIMCNRFDGEVLEMLSGIQANLEPLRIVKVREADESAYVISPLRDMAAPPPPPPPPPPPEVAIVRLARKFGHSAPYQLTQRFIWRVKDIWR